MPIGTEELVSAAVAQQLVEPETVERLRIECRRQRTELVSTLLLRTRMPLSALYRATALQRGIPFIDLARVVPDTKLLKGLPEPLIRRRLILPIEEVDGKVLVATADPDDRGSFETVARVLNRPTQLGLSDSQSLEDAISRSFATLAGAAATRTVNAEDPVEFLARVMREAFLRRASDIHIEPQTDSARIRLRIDGRLEEFMGGVPVAEAAGIASRIKVLAGLDIAEQRAPQDGGFTYEPPSGSNVDVRVATIPSIRGEKVTLRLLGTETEDLTLKSLGMSDGDQRRFRDAIQRPYGIILLTGPTGSGKTTTLYGALRELNTTDINIMTVEDPVEYEIAGVTQVQVGRSDKVTFASALRSLLRHDPDVLMVGEVRDAATADIAIKAAMTGHLVFSTLHTNTAVSAITRLTDLGCERFLIASTLLGSIAQRLVRRLCRNCRQPHPLSEEESTLLDVGDSELTSVFKPGECPRCLGTGFLGRTGIFECLWTDDTISDLIVEAATESEIRRQIPPSVRTLRDDGCAKVLDGVTTIEELRRVLFL